MKKKYLSSQITIVDIKSCDIITASSVIRDETIEDFDELPDMAPED